MSTARVTGERIPVDGLRRPIPRALLGHYLHACPCTAVLRHGPHADGTELRCTRDSGKRCGRRFLLTPEGRIYSLKDGERRERYFASFFGSREQ